MTRFNTASVGKTHTTNLAGGPAYTQTPKIELASLVLTSFVADQFYREADDSLARVGELVAKVDDPKFVAQLAIFARQKYNMRSISHVLAGHVARSRHSTIHGMLWKPKFFEALVVRPDDITETMAFMAKTWGRPFWTKAMKKGFGAKLSQFSEYQLAKYKMSGKDITLVDAVNLLHPKPTVALENLMTGKLKPADTWETKLTAAGQKAETKEEKEALKTEAWKELVTSGKIGYFALLRNLRNIHETGDESLLEKALELLGDRVRILKSRVLPFRFAVAMDQIQKLPGAQSIILALSFAMDISLENVPSFEGKTCVVLDDSGSMGQGFDSPAGKGALFSAALIKRNYADFIHFSTDAEYMNLNPEDSIMSLVAIIHAKRYAQGTDFIKPFTVMNAKYDRIIIISDMQGWQANDGWARRGDVGTGLRGYMARMGGQNPFVYSLDLTGYGTVQLPESRVFCLTGFSEKIFDVMKMLETDRNALVHEIEAVTF